MLQSFLFNIPFIIIRTCLIILEGLTLFACGYYGSSFVLDYAGNYVPSFFLLLLTPMAWIIGLGVGAFIVKWLFGFIQYYLKLAQIIYLTSVILEYKPQRGSRFIFAFNEAIDNFVYLSLNDFTTKTVVTALVGLKDAIMNNDILSRFKESDNTSYKLVKSLSIGAIRNVINMTDEIIISYTWFTNDMYKANRRREKKKKPGIKTRTKNQAKFMLEGLVFLIRIFPKLLLNSAIFELLVFIGINILIIVLLVTYIGVMPFSYLTLFLVIVFYRTLLHIFYYVIVHSFRLLFYLYSFYYEVGKLEPFDIKESLSSLVGKVPVLGALVKRGGQEVNPMGSEGEPILDVSVQEILTENVGQIAEAFNLSSDDLLEPHVEEIVDLPTQEEAIEELNSKQVDTEEVSEDSAETELENINSTDDVEVVIDEEITIEESIPQPEIEVEVLDDHPVPNNPFANRASRNIR